MSKIYYQGRSSNHTLHVQPGVDYPLNSAWHETDGRPKTFVVHFKNHVADIDDNLARYLVDKGLAANSRLILPKSNIEVA